MKTCYYQFLPYADHQSPYTPIHQISGLAIACNMIELLTGPGGEEVLMPISYAPALTIQVQLLAIDRANPTFNPYLSHKELHTMTTKSDFKNFAVFTVDISSVEQKTSKEGQPYALAHATLPMNKGDPMPMRIVALNSVATSIVAGQSTLVGRLGYDEKDGQGMLVFFPTRVEPAPSDGKLRNYVILTLRVGQESDCRYSEAGKFWGRVRMALSQGKDDNGSYKPSLWLTVKGFTSKEGDETVPLALAKLHKGELATVTGRLNYEVSPANGKGYFNLVAFKVQAPQATHPLAVSEEDCPY